MSIQNYYETTVFPLTDVMQLKRNSDMTTDVGRFMYIAASNETSQS